MRKKQDSDWVYEGEIFNVEVKIVLDKAPLVGKGKLPDWLRNLAHSRLMVATIQTTFVYGGVLLCTEEQDQIEAKKKSTG